jgi:predicted membrane-bound spermidine synthase
MVIFIFLGIITSIFQLIVLREFSFSIGKHELGFVLAAGFWIASCSLGSMVKLPQKILRLQVPVLNSLFFSFSICLIHLAKLLIGLKYYEAASLKVVMFSSLFLVGPTAFIAGASFRYFLQKYLKTSPAAAQNAFIKFFAFEALGFFLGGLAFVFFLKDYVNPLIFSLLPLLLLPDTKEIYKKLISGMLIIAITVALALNFNLIIKKEFADADILNNLGSAYGPVIIIRKAGLTTLFAGGSLLATSQDKQATEEFIHMSLVAADPSVNQNILFIGPPVSGQINEITKYKLASLDCLQINPLLWRFVQDLTQEKLYNKVNFITGDPRAYLKKAGKQYDAILMNMPPPANLALNRYLTEEFFKLVAARLKPNGIFSFSIPSKREILSPQFIKFDSSIVNALDKAFTYRLIIPSEAMMIIASNRGRINGGYLLENFSRLNPKTDFFTIYHFKDYLDPAMRSYTENMLDSKITPNSDLNPTGFLNYIILEQSKFYPNIKIDFKKTSLGITVFLILCGLFIILASRRSAKASCLLNIGAVGFTSISLSSIIFVLFQIFCATLFWKLGLLTAFFMAGVAVGVFAINIIKIGLPRQLSWLYLCWMIAATALFFNLKTLDKSNNAELIFYAYAWVYGLLTGNAYPLLAQNLLDNKFKQPDLALTIYSWDLIGAFLGTLACGVMLIPFLGIPYSLLILIFLNAIFALKNLKS